MDRKWARSCHERSRSAELVPRAPRPSARGGRTALDRSLRRRPRRSNTSAGRTGRGSVSARNSAHWSGARTTREVGPPPCGVGRSFHTPPRSTRLKFSLLCSSGFCCVSSLERPCRSRVGGWPRPGFPSARLTGSERREESSSAAICALSRCRALGRVDTHLWATERPEAGRQMNRFSRSPWRVLRSTIYT